MGGNPESARNSDQILFKPEGEDKVHKLFNYMGHPLEFDPNLSAEEKLSMLCNSEWLSPYGRIITETLLPESIGLTYNRDVEIDPTGLDESLKDVRRNLMASFGFTSPKKKGKPNYAVDNFPLGLAFTEDTGTLVRQLRLQRQFDRLEHVSQTNITPYQPSQGTDSHDRYFTTRADHSLVLAREASFTLFTLALRQPQLFIAEAEKALARYGMVLNKKKANDITFDVQQFLTESTKYIVDGAITKPLNDLKNNDPTKYKILKNSLEYAYELLKYYICYFLWHDIKTSAWGDRTMRTLASILGQKSISHDENTALAEGIHKMLHDRLTEIPAILNQYKINPDLLEVMIRCAALGSDPFTLLGFIAKDKRKFTDDIIELFPHLAFFKGKPGIDHDTLAGTNTNVADVANKILPGGYITLTKDLDFKPEGSFELRLKILANAMELGATAQDLTKACIELGIDPRSLCIASQEINIGPNLEIASIYIPKENRQVRETVLAINNPGVFKRLKQISDIFTYHFYVNSRRYPIELIAKDMIMCGLWGEENEEDASLHEKDYIYMNDEEYGRYLGDVSPLLPWMFSVLPDHVRIITEDELRKLAVSDDNNLQHSLVKRVDMATHISRKQGTLLKVEDGIIADWQSVLGKKKEDSFGSDRLQDSVPGRLDALEKKLNEQRQYCLIDLSLDRIRYELLSKLDSSITRISNSRALLMWTQDIELSNGVVIKMGLRDEFKKYKYEVNEPLLKPRSEKE